MVSNLYVLFLEGKKLNRTIFYQQILSHFKLVYYSHNSNFFLNLRVGPGSRMTGGDTHEFYFS